MAEKYSHCPHITDQEMKATCPRWVAGYTSPEHRQVSAAGDVHWGALTWAVWNHLERACSVRREEKQGLSLCKVLFQRLPLIAWSPSLSDLSR